MRPEIGDYALLGDTRTAVLVSRGGSVDWLCVPRYDSPACFASILGGSEHGRWLLAPAAAPVASRRRYRGDTLVLETEYEGREGAVTVVDAMPVAGGPGGSIVREVIGRGGRVHGPGGERHLPEREATWLPGHHGSAPVRVGNAAAGQFQLDVYGEVADAQYALVLEEGYADGQRHLIRRVLAVLEQAWRQPDEGIWEVRGPRRHFTCSKVMAWAAFDRAVKLAQLTGLDGPHHRWRALRDEIHAEVCSSGFDTSRNSFGLAGRCAGTVRPARRGMHAVRAGANAAQRRGAACRAIRPSPWAAHRQLPAGPLTPGTGQHRAAALTAAGGAGREWAPWTISAARPGTHPGMAPARYSRTNQGWITMTALRSSRSAGRSAWSARWSTARLVTAVTGVLLALCSLGLGVSARPRRPDGRVDGAAS